MRWIPFITTLILLLPYAAFGQRSIQIDSNRLALVIGNSNYRAGPLRNPVNDAKAMSETLTELGFSVTLVKDGSLRDMEQAVREFGRKLRRGEAGLFYYAGHGLQVNGENYLVPIGAAIEKQEDVRYEAMSVGRVLAEMEAAENRLNILILDACRNNPFARAWRSSAGGLAQMSAPSGTLIAYATAPGSVASDGARDNGLYTEMLLKHLQEPGLQVEEMFKKVRISVMDETDGEQTPWESSSLVGNLVFNKLQANLTVQKIIAPDAPTSTDFSLDDLFEQADEIESVKAAWEKKLTDMTNAFAEVRQMEKRGVDIAIKINAWQRFQQAFKEENPYSINDNDMLTQSRSRISALHREQKQSKLQFATIGKSKPTLHSSLTDVPRIGVVPFKTTSRNHESESNQLRSKLSDMFVADGRMVGLHPTQMPSQPHEWKEIVDRDWRLLDIDYLIVGSYIRKGQYVELRYELFDTGSIPTMFMASQILKDDEGRLEVLLDQAREFMPGIILNLHSSKKRKQQGAVKTENAFVVGGKSEKELYDEALNQIKKRKYALAIRQLGTLVTRFPDSSYAANAYYWLGEVYAAKPTPEYENAQHALVQIITYFPENPKLPEALFKLGKVYHLMGECHRATEMLKRVIAEYRLSDVGRLAERYLSANVKCKFNFQTRY